MFLTFLFLFFVIRLTWYNPIYGLAIVANAFLFNAMLGNTDGVYFALVDLGGPLFCFATIILSRFLYKKPLKANFGFDTALVFMFFFVSFLSVFYAHDMSKSFEVSIKYLAFCASFYFTYQYILFVEKDKEKAIVQMLHATLLIWLLVGILALIKCDSASQNIMRLTIGELSPVALSLLLGQAALVSFYFFITSQLNSLFFKGVKPYEK